MVIAREWTSPSHSYTGSVPSGCAGLVELRTKQAVLRCPGPRDRAVVIMDDRELDGHRRSKCVHFGVESNRTKSRMATANACPVRSMNSSSVSNIGEDSRKSEFSTYNKSWSEL